MKRSALYGRAVLLLAAALCAPAYAQTPPPVPKVIELKTVTCNDLLNAQLLDRTAAIMYLWGYEAGKTGATAYYPATTQANTRKLMKLCEAHHGMTLVDAAATVLGNAGK
ncbi:MAG: hypothetical protein JO359_03620 [Candidatus Eremiobacteraeota bacterium]|nr:hypothetical protein [Candidatus Eremiobacteraeota bacterium]